MTRDKRQAAIGKWVRSTFGEECYTHDERIMRFLEEAIELVQTEDISIERILRLAIHVYSKPKGVPYQEIGGVSITLLAYCEFLGISADTCELTEWGHISAINPEYFRNRHNKKADANIAARCNTEKPSDILQNSPIENIINSLEEFATTIELDWTYDDTTIIQSNRFKLATQKIREANTLLKENNEEFKREM